MENSFYWSQPARPYYSSNIRDIPLQSIHQKPAGIKPATKVVQIPVHFVSSDPDRPDRSGSALRIQKVFRGFLVRKSVKRIISLRKEVDDIERKILCGETTELIRRDERERLRVNEKLMSLLFKLDSIRGVDSGVRECRKAVIKKAIFLQEKVDSIVSTGNQIAAEEENQCNDFDELSESVNQDEYGKSTNQNELCDLLEQSVDVENQATSDYTTNGKNTPVEQLQEESDCPIRECMEGSVDRYEVRNVTERADDENETRSCGLDGEEESRRNRELLEAMVKKNEKMMNELCQKNEVQTRMLNSLAHRVDQLERAFVCEYVIG